MQDALRIMAFDVHDLIARDMQHLRTAFDRISILDNIGQNAVHGALKGFHIVRLEQIARSADFKALGCKIQCGGAENDRPLVSDLAQTTGHIDAERRLHENIQQNDVEPASVTQLIIERLAAFVHHASIRYRV